MNETVTITAPDEVSQAVTIADGAYQIALACVIDSPEMFQVAGDELRAIVSKKRKLEELRKSLTKPIDESKARIMAFFEPPTSRLEEAEKLLRRSMGDFQKAEDERIAKEKRAAEARAAAEREELERQRQEAEAAALAAREAADKAATPEERAAAAQAVEDAAVVAEEAAAQAELAAIAPPVPVAAPKAKASGITTRDNWKAEVTDLQALILAAAEGIKDRDTTLVAYLLPNTTAIGQIARALKDQARIPGVRIFNDPGLSVRGK